MLSSLSGWLCLIPTLVVTFILILIGAVGFLAACQIKDPDECEDAGVVVGAIFCGVVGVSVLAAVTVAWFVGGL